MWPVRGQVAQEDILLIPQDTLCFHLATGMKRGIIQDHPSYLLGIGVLRQRFDKGEHLIAILPVITSKCSCWALQDSAPIKLSLP